MLRSKASRWAAAPYLVWMCIFIVVPLAIVVWYALTDANGSFTLANLTGIGRYASVFGRSLLLAAEATVICLVLAFPVGYFLSRLRANKQHIMLMLVMLPMWMNLLIRTYSMMILMQDTGVINTVLSALNLPNIHMINTQGAVVFGMVYNYIPYMILPLYNIMAKMDHSLIEAAEDLGGNKLTVFKNIIFPLSLPGIASGFTMVFVPSVSTFYISKKLGGNTFSLIGDVIEMQFKSVNNYNLGAALSLVLMVLIIICMLVMNHFTGDDDDGGVLI